MDRNNAVFFLRNKDKMEGVIDENESRKILYDPNTEIMCGVGSYVEAWQYIPTNKQPTKKDITKNILGRIIFCYFLCWGIFFFFNEKISFVVILLVMYILLALKFDFLMIFDED